MRLPQPDVAHRSAGLAARPEASPTRVGVDDPGPRRHLLAGLALLACLQASCVRPPTLLRGGGWLVEIETSAPDSPADNSVYFELGAGDGIERGVVDVVVHLHNIDRPLVRARGAVDYGRVEGAAQPLEYQGFENGYFFERCRLEVDYHVDDRGPGEGIVWDVAVRRAGLLERVLRGGCEGVDDSGALMVLRFALRGEGTVRLDLPAEAGILGETPAGTFIDLRRVYPAELRVRRR